MKKRILSILLCCVMLVGLLPTVAYAEPERIMLTEEILESSPYKVESELGNYYKLSAGHYYLGENISVDDPVYIGTYETSAIVTLDLNGHALSKNNDTVLLFLQNNSTLTLMDSSVTKTGKIISNYAITFNDGAIFNANGGTIEGNVYIDGNNAKIDNTDSLYVTEFRNGQIKGNYTTAIINGGTFYSTVDSYRGRITGGTFYGTVNGGTIEESAKVTVTFNSDGGTSVDEQKVLRGQKATAPTAPTKAGYSFEGWYNGATKFDFANTPVTDDITLTAQWTPAEQFNLTLGETYWFDLSGANIPGNKNGSLPDDSLHWVPFT